MSTLVGTALAVVVGPGAGATAGPPEAPPLCWNDGLAYFEDWDRGLGGTNGYGADGLTGCSSPSGYPWVDDNYNPNAYYNINGTFKMSATSVNFFESTHDITIPIDSKQCTITFPLTQAMTTAVTYSNEVRLELSLTRLDANENEVSGGSGTILFRIDQLSNYPTPGIDHTRLLIEGLGGGTDFSLNDVTGLLLTSGGTVTITITPTSLSMSVANSTATNSVTLPWSPLQPDPSTVMTLLEWDSTIDCEEGNYRVFYQEIGKIQISSPYGNCDSTITPSGNQTIDNYNRTVADSTTAGFGTSSGGSGAWDNAGHAGGITPATKTIGCDGANGLISIIGGGGIGENSWFTSLNLDSIFRQEVNTRDITFRFYWTISAQSDTTKTQWYFSLHAQNSSTSYASWSLPSGGDGLSDKGATAYYTYTGGGRYLDTRVDGSSDITSISAITTGTAYVTEIYLLDGTCQWRHWAASGTRPSTPTHSMSMAANEGPLDGIAIGLGVSNSGTPSATLSMQQVDVEFEGTSITYTVPRC